MEAPHASDILVACCALCNPIAIPLASCVANDLNDSVF